MVEQYVFLNLRTNPILISYTKFQNCPRKTVRRILQVVCSDRMTNAEASQRTNTKDIVAVGHSLNLKCGGGEGGGGVYF